MVRSRPMIRPPLKTLPLLALALTFTLPLHAAEKRAKKVPAATPVPVRVFAPTDLRELRPLLGQTVAVEGAIARVGESKSKTVRYLNYTSDYKLGVGLVFFVKKAPESFQMEALSKWIGRKTRATGKLGEFNGALQIEVVKLSQLKEVE